MALAFLAVTYLAIIFLIALAVFALVLLLEHRGDPRELEHEYRSLLTLQGKHSRR